MRQKCTNPSKLSLKLSFRGVCGEVRLAFSKGNECKKFAIKIISKNRFSISSVSRLVQNLLVDYHTALLLLQSLQCNHFFLRTWEDISLSLITPKTRFVNFF